MIIDPIIPIWLMIIVCIIAFFIILYNGRKKEEDKKISKYKILNIIMKIIIIILLFIINLRFKLPNGEAKTINANISILFVIDKSVSMRALDYNGDKERFEGVVNDCCKIVDELSSCNFSIITFGDTAQRLILFTNDTDMVQSQLKAITLEDDTYVKGSSLNLPKDIIEETLKKEKK